jgi:hypothetical protein
MSPPKNHGEIMALSKWNMVSRSLGNPIRWTTKTYIKLNGLHAHIRVDFFFFFFFWISFYFTRVLEEVNIQFIRLETNKCLPHTVPYMKV